MCMDYELKTTWKIVCTDVIQELICLDCSECEISQMNILFSLISVVWSRKLRSCYMLDFPAHPNTQTLKVSLTLVELITVFGWHQLLACIHRVHDDPCMCRHNSCVTHNIKRLTVNFNVLTASFFFAGCPFNSSPKSCCSFQQISGLNRSYPSCGRLIRNIATFVRFRSNVSGLGRIRYFNLGCWHLTR